MAKGNRLFDYWFTFHWFAASFLGGNSTLSPKFVSFKIIFKLKHFVRNINLFIISVMKPFAYLQHSQLKYLKYFWFKLIWGNILILVICFYFACAKIEFNAVHLHWSLSFGLISLGLCSCLIINSIIITYVYIYICMIVVLLELSLLFFAHNDAETSSRVQWHYYVIPLPLHPCTIHLQKYSCSHCEGNRRITTSLQYSIQTHGDKQNAFHFRTIDKDGALWFYQLWCAWDNEIASLLPIKEASYR